MTPLEACDAIEEVIRDLHPHALQGWDWSFTEELTDEEHSENFRETLKKTRTYFDMPEKTSMWFASPEGESIILATCGNSPTAKARTRYLCYVNPKNLMLLISRLRELEANQKEK
jgi:hypothetical protein